MCGSVNTYEILSGSLNYVEKTLNRRGPTQVIKASFSDDAKTLSLVVVSSPDLVASFPFYFEIKQYSPEEFTTLQNTAFAGGTKTVVVGRTFILSSGGVKVVSLNLVSTNVPFYETGVGAKLELKNDGTMSIIDLDDGLPENAPYTVSQYLDSGETIVTKFDSKSDLVENYSATWQAQAGIAVYVYTTGYVLGVNWYSNSLTNSVQDMSISVYSAENLWNTSTNAPAIFPLSAYDNNSQIITGRPSLVNKMLNEIPEFFVVTDVKALRSNYFMVRHVPAN